jgi:hypothetical protein
MMSGNIPPIGRRELLGFAIVASVAVVPWWTVSAQTPGDASAIAPIKQLDNALHVSAKRCARSEGIDPFGAALVRAPDVSVS